MCSILYRTNFIILVCIILAKRELTRSLNVFMFHIGISGMNTATCPYFSFTVNSHYSSKLSAFIVYNSFYAVEEETTENGIFAKKSYLRYFMQTESISK